MPIQFNTELLDKFIAPGISTFTSAEIPVLTSDFPQAPYWLVNHFLNNFTANSFKDGVRQVVIGYLRRVHHAFTTYHSARDSTLTYLDRNRPDYPKVRTYYDTIAILRGS